MSFHSNMYGIIYKFTIIAKYKFDGHRPFYVGQHWEKRSVEHFSSSSVCNYDGSGKIWNNFIKRLKKEFPTCWRKIIKREILYASELVNQKGLDILEEYYIKKTKSHYSYEIGGCNILWGASRKPGMLNPMKDPNVAKRVAYKLRNGSHHDVSGKNNPNFGNGKAIKGDKNPMKNPEVAKRNAELRKGKKRTLEQRAKMSLSKKGKYTGKNASNYGHKWTDEMKQKMSLKKRGLL